MPERNESRNRKLCDLFCCCCCAKQHFYLSHFINIRPQIKSLICGDEASSLAVYRVRANTFDASVGSRCRKQQYHMRWCTDRLHSACLRSIHFLISRRNFARADFFVLMTSVSATNGKSVHHTPHGSPATAAHSKIIKQNEHTHTLNKPKSRNPTSEATACTMLCIIAFLPHHTASSQFGEQFLALDFSFSSKNRYSHPKIKAVENERNAKSVAECIQSKIINTCSRLAFPKFLSSRTLAASFSMKCDQRYAKAIMHGITT